MVQGSTARSRRPAAHPARAPWPVTLATLALAVGCSSLGDGGKGGGAASLPNRGVSGYELITSPLAEIDEETGEPVPNAPAFVVLDAPDPPVDRRSPTALIRDERIVLYYEEVGATGSRVMRAESDDGITFSQPAVVLDTAPIEGGPIGPSITRLPTPPQSGGDVGAADRGGGASHHILVFGTADGSAIHAADSADGLEFTVRDSPLLVAQGFDEAGGIGEPSLVVDDQGRQVLFYEAASGDDRPVRRIKRAVSADAGATFTREGIALDVGALCIDVNEDEVRCWDAGSVGQPEVRLGRDAYDRRIWRMSYAGGSAGSPTSLALAFSFDGVTWSRFPYNPLFEDDFTTPSNLYRDGAFYLYSAQDAGRDGTSIALAISDFGHVTETF